VLEPPTSWERGLRQAGFVQDEGSQGEGRHSRQEGLGPQTSLFPSPGVSFPTGDMEDWFGGYGTLYAKTEE
jgi:hypothetical protein